MLLIRMPSNVVFMKVVGCGLPRVNPSPHVLDTSSDGVHIQLAI